MLFQSKQLRGDFLFRHRMTSIGNKMRLSQHLSDVRLLLDEQLHEFADRRLVK